MLIVDDDRLSAKVMHRIFRNDFEIYHCDSAKEYYEKYCNISFATIIMDLAIQRSMNGYRLIKEIKSAQSKNTPLLCLTKHTHSKIRQAAIKLESDYLISKPVSTKELKAAVKSLTEFGHINKYSLWK
jgi:DNA-binding response OmpR family regulator